MRNLPFLFVVLLASCQVFSDENRKGQQSKIMTIDTVQLEAIYQQYKEPAIYHRRFKHRDVDSILQQHRGKGVLSVEQIGSSFEGRSEEHTSELQSRENLVCRLLLEKKKQYEIPV